MKIKLKRLKENIITMMIYTIIHGGVLWIAIYFIGIDLTYLQCVGFSLLGRNLYSWLLSPMHKKEMLRDAKEERAEDIQALEEDIKILEDRIAEMKKEIKARDEAINYMREYRGFSSEFN